MNTFDQSDNKEGKQEKVTLVSWAWIDSPVSPLKPHHRWNVDVLRPIRQRLDRVTIQDRKLAHRICRLIPAQCPFEREVNLFGRTLFRIPPLCKLNPLYEEFVSLRFRALCYLADECGEDIRAYC